MMACQIAEKPVPGSTMPSGFSTICYLNPNVSCGAIPLSEQDRKTARRSSCQGLRFSGFQQRRDQENYEKYSDLNRIDTSPSSDLRGGSPTR
jgi:hypothetical protein